MRTVTAALIVASVAVPAFAQSSSSLTGPFTLTPAMVRCTDTPALHRPVPGLVVKGPHTADGRTQVTSGLIIINRTQDDGLAVGQRYVTHRIYGDVRAFPKDGAGYGDVRASGVVTIAAVDEHNALASIDSFCDTVEPGDFLAPYVERALPASAPDLTPPDFSDRARVLFGAYNRALFGGGDVFSIDRGTVHGVADGTRVAFYRDRRDGRPLVYLGDAVVVDAGEQTSKVVLTRAVDAIGIDDVAVVRREP